MKLRTLAIATTIGLVAALTIASTAAADEGGGNGGGRRLSATLTGAAEVPGPGDLDGSGTVALTVRPGRNEVCFDIHVSGIALPATAAHIHQDLPIGRNTPRHVVCLTSRIATREWEGVIEARGREDVLTRVGLSEDALWSQWSSNQQARLT